jgi:hypothetical protein
MQCQKCKSELPAHAKFCPECGTAAPVETNIDVNQEVGKIKGTVVGQALDGGQLPPNLKSTTSQKVDSVEAGGIIIGTTLGKDVQVGGQRQYGNTYNVGDITGSTGIAIGENNHVTVTQGLSGDEITKVFAAITAKVSALPDGPEKTMAETAVQGLKEEAGKGEDADESKVSKWMNFLAQTTYDAFEVAVAAFVNPIAGLGGAFKKVADRARQEKGK